MLDIVCYAPIRYVSPTVRPGIHSNLGHTHSMLTYTFRSHANFAGTIMNSVDRIYDCFRAIIIIIIYRRSQSVISA